MRLLHLPLHARLDGAVHIKFFDLDIQHIADAVEALGGIEDFQQLLLFFNRKLQIGGDRIGQPGRIIHLHGRDHGLVVQRLAKLDVLLEERGGALDTALNSGRVQRRIAGGLHRSQQVSVGFLNLLDFAALQALDPDFDVAVLQLQALHDIDNGADLVDFTGFGLIHAGVMLRSQKDLLVRGKCCLQRLYAGFAAHYEGGHHKREDDHIADRHHG